MKPAFMQVAIFGDATVALGRIEKNEKLYAEGSIRISEWMTAAGEKRTGLSMAAWRAERPSSGAIHYNTDTRNLGGLGPCKRALGIDEPAFLSERSEERRECLGIRQMRMGAEELQLTRRVSRRQLREHQPPEQLGKHAHGQQEVGLACDPTAAVAGEPASPARSYGCVDDGSSPNPRCAAPQ
jgi:hypothetical protein